MEQMDKLVDDNEFIIFSNSPWGSVSGASKKIKGKRINFGFSQEVFKDPQTVTDILKSKIGAMIVGNKSMLSEKMIEEIDEYVKQQKVKQ